MLLGAVGFTGYRVTLPASNASVDRPIAAVERSVASTEKPLAYGGPAFEPERRILTDSDKLAIPAWMTSVGSHLVVIDLAADSALHVIDRSTGELTRSIGRRGAGPGEFETLWSLDPVAGSETALWAYDGGLSRLSYVDLDESYLEQGRLGERSINLISPSLLTGIARTDDGEFVSTGYFPEGRLGVFDDSGKLIDTRGSVPVASRDMEPLLRQYLYQGRTASHPDHHLLAVASRYASLVEIYRSDGELVAVGDAPLEISPDVRWVSYETGYHVHEDTEFGYVDVAGSRDLVFALFSGRTAADSPGRRNFGSEVHVFDWDGALRGVIRLQADAIGVAVDDEAKSLYVVEHDPVPAIAEYILADTDLATPR
jgi:hypothetical protein